MGIARAFWTASRHWYLARSLAHLQLHEPAEAQANLEALTALGPVPPEIAPLFLWRQVLLAQVRGDAGAARRAAAEMTRALDSMGPDAVPKHRIMARYDLAKFWSGQGDHRAAFAQWTAGHALLRLSQPFSRQEHLAFIEASIAAFPVAASVSDHDKRCDPAPIFIVGMPRSGTTLCEQILAAHARVADLTIENMAAVGGSGGALAGGGGAGLGGGLFIGSNVAGDAGSVTLNDVSFRGDTATGGQGGDPAGGTYPEGTNGGGGGGLGGAGGGEGGGGVGGVGGNANAVGTAGDIPRAFHAGSGGANAGGASGGGGGGSVNGAAARVTRPAVAAVSRVAKAEARPAAARAASAAVAVRPSGPRPAGRAVAAEAGGGGGGGRYGGLGGFGGGGGGRLFVDAENPTANGGFGGGNGAGSGGDGGGGGLAAGGDIFVEAGAALTIADDPTATIANGGVTPGAPTDHGTAGQALGSGIYIQGTGAAVTLNNDGTTETIAAAIADDKGAAVAAGYLGIARYTEGSTGIVATGAGTVILTGTNTYAGGTSISQGTLQIASVSNIGTGAVTFNAATAKLAITTTPASGSTFADTLVGFATGGTIDLTNLGFIAGATALASGTTLTLTDGSTTETFTLNASATGTTFYTSRDTGTGTQISSQPCYLAGTRIATRRGEVAVETLVAGDEVLTVSGAFKPIVWMGRRSVVADRHPRPETVWPIRIKRDAFGPGMPRRRLYVSPDHAVYWMGMLIPMKLLVNGASIQQERRRSVTYHHVELPRHDVLFAEGLPAESYLDTGNRMMFEPDGQPLILYPDFATGQHGRETLSCAPFADRPDQVEPVWRFLSARAEAMGWRLPVSPVLDEAPDLHIVIGTRRIEPVAIKEGRYSFVVPRGDAPVRLVSRAARPDAARPWISDVRRLGVRVGRLTHRNNSDAWDVAA